LGRVPPDLPDAGLAGATEREVQLALESRWRFLTSRPSAVYLNKILRQVVKRFNGTKGSPRVVLFEDAALRTLALPSGMILLSQGTLDELEDEAQLAFVLAHDLAHAFSGDAAARLVRLGFHAVAHEGEAQEEAAWADAAEDLVRLGYGRERERRADARAFEAVLALGYDPRSVVHYLQHLESLGERGDPKVADLFLAHPPARDRLRRLEETLARHVESKPTRRVNREVFRRAAGRHASSVETAALSDFTAQRDTEAETGSLLAALLSRLPWVAVVAALITALILIFGFLL
jgi:predicted Zn-dependent protease